MVSQIKNEKSVSIVSHAIDDEVQHADFEIKTSSFSAEFVSDRGGKSENQDCFGFTASHDGAAVFCVADGLGGHAGGRIASAIAVKSVIDFVQTDTFSFDNPESLVHAFRYANSALHDHQNKHPEVASMRTTLVVLVIKDSLAFWAHVGDVRLYHFRGGRIQFQTRDHSVPQMLVDAGEISADQMRHHPDRSKLLNALGADKCKPSIPLKYTQLQTGDAFHLSSDGFWEWISDSEICNLLQQESASAVVTEKMADLVVRRARAKEPDHDNLTAQSQLH